MKRKLFIATVTTVIVVGVILMNYVVTTIRYTPAQPLSQEEQYDTALAQYGERSNGGAGRALPSSNFLIPIFYPDRNALVEGCSLRFALVPAKKAVDPGGTIAYTITISNIGKETCVNAGLSMFYSDKESFVSSQPSPTASDYYWHIGDLDSAAGYQLSLTTKNAAKENEQLLTEGCVSGDNSSDICAQTAIFIQKGASASPTLAERLSTISISKLLAVLWGQLFSKKEFGIWVWDTPQSMTSAHAGQVLTTAKQSGFNVIYLSIDDYVPIAGEKDDEKRGKQTDQYMAALASFVKAANDVGIQVDAVGGEKTWSQEEHRWKGYALIEFVRQYNALYPHAKLRNLQYDVEPYLLPEYAAQKSSVLRSFIEFIDESAQRMKDVPAGFVVVIPHFYDKEQEWTPPFEYWEREEYAFTHLLRVLSQKKDTGIIIMAYRNFFEESNGVRQISEAELKEADAGKYATKIVIAQETGDVAPAYVTYHDYPKSALFDGIRSIQDSFKNYGSFGGVAVHYFDAFLKLSAEQPSARTTIIERIRTVTVPAPKATTTVSPPPTSPPPATSTPQEKEATQERRKRGRD